MLNDNRAEYIVPQPADAGEVLTYSYGRTSHFTLIREQSGDTEFREIGALPLLRHQSG